MDPVPTFKSAPAYYTGAFVLMPLLALVVDLYATLGLALIVPLWVNAIVGILVRRAGQWIGGIAAQLAPPVPNTRNRRVRHIFMHCPVIFSTGLGLKLAGELMVINALVVMMYEIKLPGAY